MDLSERVKLYQSAGLDTENIIDELTEEGLFPLPKKSKSYWTMREFKFDNEYMIFCGLLESLTEDLTDAQIEKYASLDMDWLSTHYHSFK